MKIASVVVALSLFLAASSSQAQIFDGNKLKQFIQAYKRVENRTVKDPMDFADAATYQGYVAAVWDTFSEAFCPGSVTLGQLAAVVTKYVEAHPEKWTTSASTLTLQAFGEAFPRCSKK